MYLLTSNPSKYAPFADLLAQMQITLRVPDFELPELQSEDSLEVIARKARQACEALDEPCLVDDAGLLLDAYPGFPGPLTRSICKSLGAAGLERLLAGTSDRARMVCHLGCWVQGELRHWQGEAAGRVDPCRPVESGPGPLAQWFVPDEPGVDAAYLHRRRALESLGRDIALLRQEIASLGSSGGSCTVAPVSQESQGVGVQLPRQPRDSEFETRCAVDHNPDCAFCQEFNGEGSSVYHELLGEKLPSRLIHATEHFLVFPPLGQFVDGGLLITTREHRFSMAHLPDAYYEGLERLMAETSDVLLAHYGCRPLFFEHAPVAPGDKGTCCVDHAHLNIFPVRVDVHSRLIKKFPHFAIGGMCQLKAMAKRGQAYLFLQTNVGTRFVYDAGLVPSQYIRRIITAELGKPERWHWRDYLGLEELERTYATLAGWRSSDAPAR
jgi:inosine/xanthosine triphosphate pyrophosphatase family protein